MPAVKKPRKRQRREVRDPQDRGTTGYPSFKGKRPFFLGILPGPDKLYPAHGIDLAGVHFPRGEQRPYPTEEEDGVWLRLSTPPEPGTILRLSFDQISAILDRVKWRIVRWRYGQKEDRFGNKTRSAMRADIIDMGVRMRTLDEKQAIVEGPRVYQVEDGDEPLSKYLVLIPETDLANLGGRGAMRDLPGGTQSIKVPSMLDLDPSLDIRPWEAAEED